ncbi:MAG: polysaccharide deacetylase family protein [Candidatus Angelobacter sp.]
MLPVSMGLKSLGHSISFHSGASAVMARRQGCARILMYHGIVAAEAKALAAQLRYLVRNFNVVSLETMVDRLASDAGANDLVLTFDDGLRNNLSVVYPVLRELLLPATFFVCPALIDSGKWLWNHEMRCRLQLLDMQTLSDLRIKLLAPDPSVAGIVEWMKKLGSAQRRQTEETIRAVTSNFCPTPAQQEAYDIMDWDGLRALDPRLITVGSHTLTHPILTTLTAEETDFELRESRRWLEEKLQRPVDFFCYPNGSYDRRAYQSARKNYRAAVSTETGALSGKDELDLHRLPRIPSGENPALTAWRLHRPDA